MKKLLDKIIFGLFAGSFGFVAMLFIASAVSGGANAYFAQKTGEQWLATAGSFLLVATGFSVPTLVYEKENLSIGLKVLIHMAVGTIIYLIAAFSFGWVEMNFAAAAVYVLLAVVLAAVFWGIYMLCFRMQAKRMNQKIQEKQRGDHG